MVSDALVTAIALGTFGLLFVHQIRVYPLTRSVTAATGAVVLLAVGAISPTRALESVDAGTILLLFGMLAHVEALAQSGFYGWAAAQLVRRTGTVRRLTVGTLWLTAGLSALALNDAIVLLMTPVLIRALDGTDADPLVPLAAVVVGANVGSVATPLGNPQNAYVLNQSGLGTLRFVGVLAPVAVVSLLVATLLLGVRTDATPIRAAVDVPDLDRNWALSSGGFLVATFLALAALPGTNAGVVAASVGVLHLAWLQWFRRVPGTRVLSRMNWDVLVLFVGLFVVVGSLRGTPLVTALQTVGGGLGFAGATFVLSNLVSNVPAVVLLSTAVHGQSGWFLLAAVSTLAGNATPIGSAATLLVLEQASRRGVDVSPVRFLRIGLPIAVVTSAVATALVLGWPG